MQTEEQTQRKLAASAALAQAEHLVFLGLDPGIVVERAMNSRGYFRAEGEAVFDCVGRALNVTPDALRLMIATVFGGGPLPPSPSPAGLLMVFALLEIVRRRELVEDARISVQADMYVEKLDKHLEG